MEDKVTLFGNVAHNLTESVEKILIGIEAESEDPLTFYADYARACLFSLEKMTQERFSGARDFQDLFKKLVEEKSEEAFDLQHILKNLAEVGMAGHQYALDGQTHVSGLANKMTDLYARKNRDYGGSFDRSMDEFGLVVAAIRIGDKVNRLLSLIAKGGAEVKDESIADTFIDQACYSIMTLMWMEGKAN